MKLLMKQVVEKVKSFLDGRDEPISSTSDPLIEAIQKALQKKTAVHIIFSETSFTGDIIKYDTERQQLIVSGFAQNEGEPRYGLHNHFSPNHVANDKRYSAPQS